MHLGDCALCVVDFFIQNICGAAVDVEDGVHGHAQILYDAVFAKDFADVVFFDVAGQGFDHDLERDQYLYSFQGSCPTVCSMVKILRFLPLHFSVQAIHLVA